MQSVILAGGYGSRMGSLTETTPKPLLAIGGKPLLLNLMELLYSYGLRKFSIALGYGHLHFKNLFTNIGIYYDDLSIDTRTGHANRISKNTPDWNVNLVDTGLKTQTGGRLKQLYPLLSSEADFILTYGDALADLDVARLIETHRSHDRLVTMTVVNPVSRFGEIKMEDSKIVSISEKQQDKEQWINAGFFVLSRDVFDYIDEDSVWEIEPLRRLVASDQVEAYRHEGFWQCMDTPKELDLLNSLAQQGKAPWKRI